MLNEPTPTSYFNVAYNQDGSDKCTIVASNAGRSECTSNLTSDEGTPATHFSADIKNENEVDDAKIEIPAGIFTPQHTLPWGGVSTNKIVAKWKRRVKERAKQR